MAAFGFLTLLWTLVNLAIIILGVTFLVYGIMAFRKYLKSEGNPPRGKKPEED